MLSSARTYDRPLDEILAGVSRSFYLSLSVLPRGLRPQLSVAYLVARAADTVADTRVVRAARRRELLDGLRQALADERRIVPLVGEVRREIVAAPERGGDVAAPERGGDVAAPERGADVAAPERGADLAAPERGGASAAERVLLERLGDCLRTLATFDAGDRARTGRVLDTLITGMERDLQRFPEDEQGGGELRALTTLAELDEHCYFAAGCVGEYWTLMTAAHVPALRRLERPDLVARGVRLGKALQMVNVIRDAPGDLAQGRCYPPRELLERHGLEPADLRTPEGRRRARPLVTELCAIALAHVDAAFPYVLAIPRREARLRLAALWPLWIGLGTLERLHAAEDPLDPARPIKIARGEVYALVAESTAAVASDRLLGRLHERRRRRAG